MNTVDIILNKILNITLHGINDSDQHLMTLFSIILETKAKTILELGVRDGHTSDPLLLGAVLNKGKLTSVDINIPNWKSPEEFLPNYEFIQSDSLKFLESCVRENRKFDVIFLDDWHTYEHVKKELQLIDKIIDLHTVVLVHDLMCSTCPYYFHPSSDIYKGTEWEGGGPFKAVYELDINEYEWSTIPVNNGLTILRKRSTMLIQ